MGLEKALTIIWLVFASLLAGDSWVWQETAPGRVQLIYCLPICVRVWQVDCMGGPGLWVEGCEVQDVDNDGDVDLMDFGIVQFTWSENRIIR